MNLPTQWESSITHQSWFPSWCTWDNTYHRSDTYYRKCIANISDIMRALTDLTKKNISFIWSSFCQVSFEIIKIAFTNSTISSSLILIRTMYLTLTLLNAAGQEYWLGSEEGSTNKWWGNYLIPTHYLHWWYFCGFSKEFDNLKEKDYAIFMVFKKLSCKMLWFLSSMMMHLCRRSYLFIHQIQK